MQILVEHEFFSRYLTSEVTRVSAYINKIGVHETVQKIINMIYKKFEDIDFSYDFCNIFGLAYDKFKTNSVGNSGKGTGQYFTSTIINNIMIEELQPNYNDIFYDPCVGTGAIIKLVASYIYNNNPKKYENFKNNNIYANEVNPEIFKPLMINMLLGDINIENIGECDSLEINNLRRYENKFD